MCGVITVVNTIIISDLQCWDWSISSDSITVHSAMSYGILLHEGYDMIKCIRCHDDTTVDYIAFGSIADPVCLDCVTADEQDILDVNGIPKTKDLFDIEPKVWDNITRIN
tara:strand:- start:257 stop:586 length:330 start_codon:yes stop_codon:yes gene_type:complete